MNIRKGHIVTHHFAHKPPVLCQYGAGESEAHRKAKSAIYEALVKQSDISNCELEKDLGIVVPDVYAVIRGEPIAIEVQVSSLTLNQIIQRTEAYCSKGIAVLWLPLFSDKLNEKKYAPAAWEKWLHATYFGRVYYWLADLTVIPVHYRDFKLYVEESHWHDEYGQEQSAGGFERYSKRWRTPLPGQRVNIARDFSARVRQAWSGGHMNVPQCRLLQDKQVAWWK